MLRDHPPSILRPRPDAPPWLAALHIYDRPKQKPPVAPAPGQPEQDVRPSDREATHA